MELAYRLVAEDSPLIRQIRDKRDRFIRGGRS